MCGERERERRESIRVMRKVHSKSNLPDSILGKEDKSRREFTSEPGGERRGSGFTSSRCAPSLQLCLPPSSTGHRYILQHVSRPLLALLARL